MCVKHVAHRQWQPGGSACRNRSGPAGQSLCGRSECWQACVEGSCGRGEACGNAMDWGPAVPAACRNARVAAPHETVDRSSHGSTQLRQRGVAIFRGDLKRAELERAVVRQPRALCPHPRAYAWTSHGTRGALPHCTAAGWPSMQGAWCCCCSTNTAGHGKATVSPKCDAAVLVGHCREHSGHVVATGCWHADRLSTTQNTLHCVTHWKTDLDFQCRLICNCWIRPGTTLRLKGDTALPVNVFHLRYNRTAYSAGMSASRICRHCYVHRAKGK